MMYPFLTLPNKTEIVHSKMKPDGKVKVYIEKPVYDGFHSAVCYLPECKWEGIEGFSESEISYLKELVKKNISLIMKRSQNDGSK